MQDIIIERRQIAFAAGAIVLVAIAYIFLFPEPKKIVINETLELCERENPNYNERAECQKYVSFKYPGNECTFNMRDITVTDFGSCRNCVIECYG